MQKHNQRNVSLPAYIPLLKVLAGLAALLLRQAGTCTMDLFRSIRVSRAQAPTRIANTRLPTARTLQWRAPWKLRQLLSWLIGIVTAPTFLFVSGLLLIDSHSDHPLFWWSLPAIIAFGHAITILLVNQLHHWQPFTDRSIVARRHVTMNITLTAALFILAGLVSGFLPDIAIPMSKVVDSTSSSLIMMTWSSIMALVFAILSCAHAGTLHAWLCFEEERTTTLNDEWLHAEREQLPIRRRRCRSAAIRSE